MNRKQKMKYVLLLALTVAINVTGCKSNQVIEAKEAEQAKELNVDNAANLTRFQWQLQKLQGKLVTKEDTSKPLYMRFDAVKSQVNGFAGCNNFFGQYTANNEQLNFSHFAMTKKFCKKAMTIEASFSKAMTKVRGYHVTDKDLKLLDETGNIVAEFIKD